MLDVFAAPARWLRSRPGRSGGVEAVASAEDDPEQPSPTVGPSKPRLLRVLGPGLITGASDDDPSGIATYGQAGAQLGYGLLWTTLYSLPFMAAIQMVSARIGRTTGHGIAGVVGRHYPNWLLQAMTDGWQRCCLSVGAARKSSAPGRREDDTAQPRDATRDGQPVPCAWDAE